MSGKIDFNEMIKKQQLALNRLQERLKEMKEEYLTYQRMIEQMKENLKTGKIDSTARSNFKQSLKEIQD